ncbi:MAG: hypothetical protein J6J26_06985 [Bacteroides sp.]|nr:hypothetical protein [Bacteroides sp.]
MKSLMKNLGLLLVIIAAIILIAIFFTGSAAINDNAVLGGSIAMMVVGLILHIILNKKFAE